MLVRYLKLFSRIQVEVPRSTPFWWTSEVQRLEGARGFGQGAEAFLVAMCPTACAETSVNGHPNSTSDHLLRIYSCIFVG